MGTDLSYSDMTKTDPKHYDYEIVEQSAKVAGEDCWLIESRPKTAKAKKETGYIKSHVWVSKAKLTAMQVKSWVRKGKKLKYIQFAPDGRSLLAVTGRYRFQQTLKLLDPQTLKLQRVLPTTTGVVKSHAYTPDGRLLAVGIDTTRHYGIDLFDPATGKLIRRWNAGRAEAGKGIKLAFSPDGKRSPRPLREGPK